MPAAAISALFGIQYSPDEIRMMPPTSSAASSSVTDAPRPCAMAAATKPAKPAPTTTTSASWSQVAGSCRLSLIDIAVSDPFELRTGAG